MIYEPEYIKILRKSQFCGKDNKLVKLNKNENFSDQGITRIAFEKIDKAFTVSLKLNNSILYLNLILLFYFLLIFS